MRTNQVTIQIERFGDSAPDGADRQKITVYADANNLWEALAAATGKVYEIVKETEPLPYFGDLDARSEITREEKN